MGKLEDFIKTACLTSLTFLGSGEDGQGFRYILFTLNPLNLNLKINKLYE